LFECAEAATTPTFHHVACKAFYTAPASRLAQSERSCFLAYPPLSPKNRRRLIRAESPPGPPRPPASAQPEVAIGGAPEKNGLLILAAS
jgi:hypothetical protein